MELKNIPPSNIAHSALKALKLTHTKAVIFTWDGISGAAHALSNCGEEGIKRVRAQMNIQDGAVERAAIALHSFRVKPEGAAEVPAEMDTCVFCGQQTPWDKPDNAPADAKVLDAAAKDGHRLVVQIVLGAAMSQPAPAGGRIVQV